VRSTTPLPPAGQATNKTRDDEALGKMPVADIIVGKRYRRDLGNVPGPAASIEFEQAKTPTAGSQFLQIEAKRNRGTHKQKLTRVAFTHARRARQCPQDYFGDGLRARP
jgi:hypothetical protein